MSLSNRTHNLLLKAGAEDHGHRFAQVIQKPLTGHETCEGCGKTLWLLCEEAADAVRKGKWVPTCHQRAK